MGERFDNLVELCERSCRTYATRNLFGRKRGGVWSWLSYGEFAEQVAAFRGALARLGVTAGQRVAIVSDNRVEWAAACYAAQGLGAAFVPMYEAQLEKEWEFILGDCAATVAIGATNEITTTLRHLQGVLPSLRHVIGLDLPRSDDHSYAALLEIGARSPVAAVRPASSDVAGLIYTSGTTGLPKGVILSHGNITSNINAIHQVFTFAPEDRSLAFLPWAHSFGQVCELHGLLSMGCSLAMNDDVKNLLGDLAEVQPTILFAVPRIFNRLHEAVGKQIATRPSAIRTLFARGIAVATRRTRGEAIGLVDRLVLRVADRLIFATVRQRFGGRLKYAISGSAALSPAVADFIDALGIMVYEGYGLTETSPIATANYPGHRRLGTVGRPVPGVHIEIDRSASENPEQGEIVVHGPNVMQGYHNRPEENAAVFTPDRGLRTGDLGRLDADGYLHITGRIKEQYKLENGKYVVPSALEEQLKLSPFIANIFVDGTNRPYNVALIVPDMESLRSWAGMHGHDLGDVADNQRVRALIEAELATLSTDIKGYERVRSFLLITEDFTTDNGLLTPTLKLKRRAVVERYGAHLKALY